MCAFWVGFGYWGIELIIKQLNQNCKNEKENTNKEQITSGIREIYASAEYKAMPLCTEMGFQLAETILLMEL